MRKLAVVDLDGVVANNREREAKAREAAKGASRKYWADLYYGTLFDPELVPLDSLVVETSMHDPAHATRADEMVAWLMGQGYEIILLSNRPHTMREATEAWLKQHGVLYSELFLKDYGDAERPGYRYMKTVDWKRMMLMQKIIGPRSIRGDLLQVLIIDDSQEIRYALYTLPQNFYADAVNITIKCSLRDALDTDLVECYTMNGETELMRQLQRVCNLAQVRSRFETDPLFELRVQHPPDERGHRGMPLVIRAWDETDNGKDYFRWVMMTQLFPVQTEDAGVVELEHLKVLLDGAGHIHEVFIDQGRDVGLLPAFDDEPDEVERQRKREEYCDKWIAHSLEEFGYLAAARYMRQSKLWPERAMKEYQQSREEAAEQIREALQLPPRREVE